VHLSAGGAAGRRQAPRRLLPVTQCSVKDLDTSRVAARGDVVLGRLDVHRLWVCRHAQRRSSRKTALPHRRERRNFPRSRFLMTCRNRRPSADANKSGRGGEGRHCGACRECDREVEEGPGGHLLFGRASDAPLPDLACLFLLTSAKRSFPCRARSFRPDALPEPSRSLLFSKKEKKNGSTRTIPQIRFAVLKAGWIATSTSGCYTLSQPLSGGVGQGRPDQHGCCCGVLVHR